MKTNPECRVCLGPCHRPTHFATLRLHQWWRKRLLLAMEPVAAGKERPPGTRRGGQALELAREAGE